MSKSKKTKPKADIDFEQELWDAANELRGAVAENQYKDYVLSLLFVKHLSERYEIRKDEIKKEFNNPKSEYYTKKRSCTKSLSRRRTGIPGKERIPAPGRSHMDLPAQQCRTGRHQSKSGQSLCAH